jgi:N-acyl homoserine lactone hydrolase
MFRVFALSCGSLEFDRSLFFPAQPQGERMATPVPCYLIVHPRGKLLFDTGIHCDARTDPVGRLGRRVASLFAVRSGAGEDVVSQLATMGIRASEIRYVVNSHFHFDHCGCNASFPDAEFLVQRAELQAARAGRYNAKDWDHALAYREIDGEHDVFGDGSVVLFPTYGHTPGHQSMRVRIGARDVVMTGDACYLRRTLNEMHLPGAKFDAAQMIDSLKRLRAMRDRGAMIITGHDPEMWETVPQAPSKLQFA